MSSSRVWAGKPRRRRPLPRLVLLGVFALVVGWAANARADDKDSFREGIEAFDRKRWDEVARYMQEAIDQNSQEGERIKLYGVRFETYLPYYYLGVAQFHLGNCRAAVAAFDVSERQGAIQGRSYKDLEKKREECRAQVPPPPTPPGPSRDERQAALEKALRRTGAKLQDVALEVDKVNRLQRDAGYSEVFAGKPELATEAAAAGETLEEARKQLAAGREAGDLKLVERAEGLVVEAETRLRRVTERASTLRAEMSRRGSKPPPTSSVTPRPTSSVTPPPTSSVTPSPTSSVTPPVIPQPRPSQTSNGPPAKLRSAADAFLRAAYNETLTILEGANFDGAKAQATHHLLSAAAKYSLFLEAGDESLRETAAADVRRCRQLDAAVRPTRGIFSPAFAQFFESVR